MKKFLVLLCGLVAISARLPAQNGNNGGGATGNLTAASANCLTTNSCLVLNVDNSSSGATFKVAGTMNVVINFEASADELSVTPQAASWVAFSVAASDGSGSVTSATESGSNLSLVWQANVSAYKRVRMRVSTFTSGTVAAGINLSPASARSGGGGSGSGVSGSGAAPEVAFWSSPSAITGASAFTYSGGLLTNHIPFPALNTSLGDSEASIPAAYVDWTGATFPQDAVEMIATGTTGRTGISQVGIYGMNGPVYALDVENWVDNTNGTAGFENIGILSSAYYSGVTTENRMAGQLLSPQGINGSNITASEDGEIGGVDGSISEPELWGATHSDLVIGYRAFPAIRDTSSTSTDTIGFQSVGSFTGGTGEGSGTNFYGFRADTLNFIAGDVANVYGFYAQDLAGAGGTFNAAYYAAPQTAGAHNWAFYAAGGPSFFNGLVDVASNGTNPGEISLVGNTVNQSPPANTAGFLGPISASFTAWAPNLSATSPGLDYTALGGATKNGWLLNNPTAAAAGAQQWSPAMVWCGQGWKTNTTAGSESVCYRMYNNTVQGTATPSSQLFTQISVNGGAYSTVMEIDGAGNIYPAGVVSPSGNAIVDANFGPWLATAATGSAVDGTTITPAATANPATVTFGATGSDTNINLALAGTGAGTVNHSSFMTEASNHVSMTADWTCGTAGTVSSCASATIVGSTGTPLTLTLPHQALSWDWDCDLVVGQATAATANNWNMITATNGATNVTVSYSQGDSATTFAGGATTDQASTTSTFNIGGTWTLGGTATKMPVHIHGRIEGASASGTVVSLQLVAPTPGDLVTIYRGATCWVR